MRYALILVAGLIFLLLVSTTQKPDKTLECKGCNLLIISLDAQRADHLGIYGYRRNTSPNIDALDSIVFEQFIVNSGDTFKSLPSLMSSRIPVLTKFIIGNRTFEIFRLADSDLTLAEALSRQGYETATFQSSPFFLATRTDKGFQKYYLDKEIGVESDIRLTDKVIEFLGEEHTRFFAWVHYSSPHWPYESGNSFSESFYNDSYSGGLGTINLSEEESLILDTPLIDLDRSVAQYDAETLFIDSEIGRILASMDELRQNTIVVITSDHGESLGEHGIYGHFYLYEGILRVPLLISIPDAPPAKHEKQMQGIDLAPTLFSILGIPPPQEWEGKAWRDGVAYSVASFNHYSIRQGKWKYIMREGNPGLFNLISDPKETNNLYPNFALLKLFMDREMLSEIEKRSVE